VAVGINQYPAISALNHAREDATDFHKWLIEEAGLDDDNTKLVKVDQVPDDTPREQAEPVAKHVWDALFAQMAQIRDIVGQDAAAWAESRLYFFFSGHGIAPSARDASGLAADAGPDHFGNSVSIKALVEWLLESQDFGQLVMIADCCRNKPPTGTRPGPPPWTPRRHHRGEVRLAEFYATIYGDPAREPRPDQDPDSQRGYFTKAILDGLRGGAPLGPNGSITTISLANYARQKVMRATDSKQVPPADVGADFVLVEGVVPKPPGARPVRLVFPAGFGGAVQLLDATFQVRAQSAIEGQDWVIDLEPSLYQLVAPANGAGFKADGAFAVRPGEGELRVTF
jgi:uncharacterized caspase-like protein